MLFQHSDPSSQLKIVRSTHEKMHMVRHDDVATNGDVMPRMSLLRERYKCRVHRVGCEQLPPAVRTECDEKARVVCKNPTQSRRDFWIFLHAVVVAASLWRRNAHAFCGHVRALQSRRKSFDFSA